ncbi:MAG TPA: DUF6755 family protein [Vicinamibacterales bacterium]|nr:DUF6755 family protein [Vicinamibacterales bacterium]
MKGLPNVARRRRRVAIDAAMIMVILVLMVQMWLLTATLESYLAGHHGAALPGLLASTVLFGLCLFLYRLVLRIDRVPDRVQESEGQGFGPWEMGDITTRSRTRAAQHVDLVERSGHDTAQQR